MEAQEAIKNMVESAAKKQKAVIKYGGKGGPDPAQSGIGNQNPNRPGAANLDTARKLKASPEKKKEFAPKDTPVWDENFIQVGKSDGKGHVIKTDPRGVTVPEKWGPYVPGTFIDSPRKWNKEHSGKSKS